jgi:hypothetical protein
MVETDGVKVRGAAEAGSGADLTLWLEGGLGSRRSPDERSVKVIADCSHRSSHLVHALPRIESAQDIRRLAKLLKDLLAPSLEAIVSMSKAEAEAWDRDAVPPDSWPEIREGAQRAEASGLVSQAKALLEISAITGRDRALLLYEAFQVGDLEALQEVPVSLLRGQMVAFSTALREHADEAEESNRLRSMCRGLVESHGLGGTGGEARTKRAQLLLAAFGVGELDALSEVSGEALRAGFEAFQAGLPSNGVSA